MVSFCKGAAAPPHTSLGRPHKQVFFQASPDIPDTSPCFQSCISPRCGATYGIDEVRVACGRCGNLLDVAYDWERLPVPKSLAAFEGKWARRHDPHCFSGVWRFHELLPFAPLEQCVTIGEGQTLLHASDERGPLRGPAPRPAASCNTRG